MPELNVAVSTIDVCSRRTVCPRIALLCAERLSTESAATTGPHDPTNAIQHPTGVDGSIAVLEWLCSILRVDPTASVSTAASTKL
mmetsp:Transcript_123214/g.299289  ORF Transcript_123214/g.299289 Transcript_123214/m.299289 type:complete len:85 (-) Transcript_123214:16-270(-)